MSREQQQNVNEAKLSIYRAILSKNKAPLSNNRARWSKNRAKRSKNISKTDLDVLQRSTNGFIQYIPYRLRNLIVMHLFAVEIGFEFNDKLFTETFHAVLEQLYTCDPNEFFRCCEVVIYVLVMGISRIRNHSCYFAHNTIQALIICHNNAPSLATSCITRKPRAFI